MCMNASALTQTSTRIRDNLMYYTATRKAAPAARRALGLHQQAALAARLWLGAGSRVLEKYGTFAAKRTRLWSGLLHPSAAIDIDPQPDPVCVLLPAISREYYYHDPGPCSANESLTEAPGRTHASRAGTCTKRAFATMARPWSRAEEAKLETLEASERQSVFAGLRRWSIQPRDRVRPCPARCSALCPRTCPAMRAMLRLRQAAPTAAPCIGIS